MKEAEKDNLYITFSGVINSIIDDKRKNPKNIKTLEKFEARINMGLQVQEDYVFWVHLIADDGNYTLGRDKLEDFDLEIISDPEDLMYFSNGEYSTLHMMFKKNKFGNRKLLYKKGNSGKGMFGILLKMPKILVLDKVKPPK